MDQSYRPRGRRRRPVPRNFGRAKVGCYDETAVLKGVSVEPSVRLIPLGGLGEIGLNMMLIESGDDVVAVDCGLMFPDDELPGVDYVIPDFSYALAKRERFHGVVLTHGHEDHIGALPYLLKSAHHLEVVGFRYSRISNPTTAVLERRVAALEGGVDALCV